MKNNKAQSQAGGTINLVPSETVPLDESLTAGERNMSKGTLFMTRVFGFISLALSVSLFVQLVPFLFLFVAGYIGVPADKSLNNMNSMVWILSCVTIMLVTVYGFIAWMKFLWRRLIIQPKSIFTLIKRRGKRAE
jgi:hypothetical protein